MFQTLSFKELSAWVMACACLVSGGVYYLILNSVWQETGEWIVPIVPFIAMTVILIVLSVFGHIIAAIIMRSSANEGSDERDKAIRQKAGYVSGYILGGTVLVVLLASMFNPNGFLIFHAVFGCLLLSQIAEYVLQIIFYRQTNFSGEAS